MKSLKNKRQRLCSKSINLYALKNKYWEINKTSKIDKIF